MNRFAKLFAMAKVLGIEKEMLSEGAAQWNGQASLRSLSAAQLAEYEHKLQEQVNAQWRARRESMKNAFAFVHLHGGQYNYLLDLLADIFATPQQFAAWLKRYFDMDEERVGPDEAAQVIEALKDMRSRGYRV